MEMLLQVPSCNALPASMLVSPLTRKLPLTATLLTLPNSAVMRMQSFTPLTEFGFVLSSMRLPETTNGAVQSVIQIASGCSPVDE